MTEPAVYGDTFAPLRDEEGRAIGYQVGRAHNIAEWKAKKEEERWKLLENRLRARKWQMEAMEEGGELAERIRKRKREYQARPHVRARYEALAKIRRRERYAKNPRIRTCKECGLKEELPFRRGGMVGEFCGNNCRQKYRYHEKRGRRQ